MECLISPCTNHLFHFASVKSNNNRYMFAPQLAVYGVFDTPHEEDKSVSMSDAMRSFLSSDAADDVTSSFFLMKIEREQREREQVTKVSSKQQQEQQHPGLREEASEGAKSTHPSRLGLVSPRRARQSQIACNQASMNKSFGSYDLPSFPSSVTPSQASGSAPMPTYTIREPHVSESGKKKNGRDRK